MSEAVTLGQLMQLVMRLQADMRRLGAALDEYGGWQDIPGANAEFCASVVDSMGLDLEMLRDTLHDEHSAALVKQVGRETQP